MASVHCTFQFRRHWSYISAKMASVHYTFQFRRHWRYGNYGKIISQDLRQPVPAQINSTVYNQAGDVSYEPTVALTCVRGISRETARLSTVCVSYGTPGMRWCALWSFRENPHNKDHHGVSNQRGRKIKAFPCVIPLTSFSPTPIQWHSIVTILM